MILYCIVAAVTILLACQFDTNAYMDRVLSRRKMLNGVVLAAIFCILTALAAFRVEVGNDYGTYIFTCHEIFQRGYVITESGFNFVVRLLYTLSGKEDHFLMFAVFGALIVAVFLKSFKDQSDSFALSVFLFMTMGIYFLSFNTVRYYFALALSLYSLRYVVGLTDNRNGESIRIGKVLINWQNLMKFIIIILLAATFHKSVLAVIPMYLIARIPWNKWITITISVAGIIAFALSDKLIELLLMLYPSYRGTVYLEETRTVFDNIPMIGRCVLVLVICLFFYKDAIADNVANRTYFNMNILAIVLYLTCWWVPLVTRFGYYLITAHILLLPGVICSVKDINRRKALKYLIILFGLVYFVYFLFTASNDGIRVLPYESWLFTHREWRNQTDLFY